MTVNDQNKISLYYLNLLQFIRICNSDLKLLQILDLFFSAIKITIIIIYKNIL